MDALDRQIIAELQENFPLQENPYAIMADNLGIGAEALWERVCALVESGVIRRVGFSLDSRKMGYSSTLAAIRVPAGRVEEASELIARYPKITHSYLRDDAFNVWFTVIVENEGDISTILKELAGKLGLSDEDMMNLPAEKVFKIDARFKFTD